mmetsp:Transcript_90486/g.277098  ORF Transcript_90486/g.277098 Transcript_90486/m.277098 type:complete len:298 (+) Transcript_90486:647-1540(+)
MGHRSQALGKRHVLAQRRRCLHALWVEDVVPHRLQEEALQGVARVRHPLKERLVVRAGALEDPLPGHGEARALHEGQRDRRQCRPGRRVVLEDVLVVERKHLPARPAVRVALVDPPSAPAVRAARRAQSVAHAVERIRQHAEPRGLDARGEVRHRGEREEGVLAAVEGLHVVLEIDLVGQVATARVPVAVAPPRGRALREDRPLRQRVVIVDDVAQVRVRLPTDVRQPLRLDADRYVALRVDAQAHTGRVPPRRPRQVLFEVGDDQFRVGRLRMRARRRATAQGDNRHNAPSKRHGG